MMAWPLLAAFDVAILALMIPIVAIVMVGFIAVAKMIMVHQSKMAEMVAKQGSEPGLVDEIRAMRGEIAELRDRVNHQTLALEDRRAASSPQAVRPPDVPERLSE